MISRGEGCVGTVAESAACNEQVLEGTDSKFTRTHAEGTKVVQNDNICFKWEYTLLYNHLRA